MITRRDALKLVLFAATGLAISPAHSDGEEKIFLELSHLRIPNKDIASMISKNTSINDLLFIKDGMIFKYDITRHQKTQIAPGDKTVLLTKGKLMSGKVPGIINTWLSPKGNKLIFASKHQSLGRAYEENGLYIYDFNLDMTTCLIKDIGLFAAPAFSPDESKVVYYYMRKEKNEKPKGEWALHLINSDGTGHRVLAPPSVELSPAPMIWIYSSRRKPPLWSKDGKNVYFKAHYGDRRERYSENTYKVSLEDERQPVFICSSMIECISKEGDKLFGIVSHEKTVKVFSINSDGSGKRYLVGDAAMPLLISPNDSLLVFFKYSIKPEGRISLSIKTDGTDLKQLEGILSSTLTWGGDSLFNTRTPINFSVSDFFRRIY